MNIRNILISIGLGAVMTSCSFFDVEPQVICSDTYYKTPDDVLHGLAGVYGVMSNSEFYGNYYTLDCSMVDDLCYINRAPADVNEVANLYKHSASTSEIYWVWREIYEGIKNANSFMNAVSQTEFDEDGKLYAEARFLRAYYHFILAQAWGNIPLRKDEVNNAFEVMCEPTPQYDALQWVASEMEACVGALSDDLTIAPSRVVNSTVHGILARVYLFMAGKSVEGTDAEKQGYYEKAMNHAWAVIEPGNHKLNPDYSQVFKNMISDKYDRENNESMWEVEFMGSRESADRWTNGRIGGLLGLQNTNINDYTKVNCNYAEGRYNASLKLWNLYFGTDTLNFTGGTDGLGHIYDSRLEWNMPPYNYKDNGLDKSWYVYQSKSTKDNPTTARAIRNVGKWRREVEYEGVVGSRMMYTGINFPILRYSDVLLMYAEASLEFYGAVKPEAYACVLKVRERALGEGKTLNYTDVDEFRQFVRNERGRELCFEATRKYDLIRWGVFVDSMKEYLTLTSDPEWSGNGGLASYAAEVGSSVSERHILLPVPLKELGTNTKMKQNPMW